MRIGALTGMRLEEIARLRVKDTAGGEFDIRQAKTKAGVRRVPIHPALEPLVVRRTAGKAPEAYLFDELKDPPPGGKRERSSKASERFTAYRRAIGIEERGENQRQSNVDFHSFRRWFITKAEQAGQPPHVISWVVGHERAGETLGRYSGGPATDQMKAVVAAVQLPKDAPAKSPGGKRMGDGRWTEAVRRPG